MINKATKTSKQLGLQFQPAKCAYLTVPQSDSISIININGHKIKKLLHKEFYQYLGVPIGTDHNQSPYDILNELIKDTNKIVKSELFDWQKIKAYKIFIHPRLIFPFRTREVKVNSIGKCTNKENLSSKLRTLIRQMLKIPSQAENCYLYSGIADGGAGLIDLRDEYCTQSIVQAFRLLTTTCEMTLNIIRYSLIHVSSPRLNKSVPDIASCLEWINDTHDSQTKNVVKTWWVRVRLAIRYFKNKRNTTITFEYIDGEFFIRITNDKRTVIAAPKNRKQLSMILHTSIHDSYAKSWRNSDNSNYLAEMAAVGFRTNKFIFKGDIGSFSWNFIHKAKTNSLPINARPMNKNIYDRVCRRCHSSEESMIHVLQKCVPNLSLITDRHDACLQKIYDSLINPNLVVYMNEICPYISDDMRRIDLIVKDEKNKIIYLVDLKCPLDTPKLFENANTKNLAKYKNFKTNIQKAKPDYRIDLYTCVIGSLGTIPPETPKLLAKIGIASNKIGNLLKSCSISNIENSARIWNYHVSGTLIKFRN